MGWTTSENTDRLFDELRALGLPGGRYAIFGSGPMGVRGLREIHDVDVVAEPSLFAELARSHHAEDHEHGLHKIQIGNVEILDGWYPDVGPVETLIASAELIHGLPFVRLEKVLEWKQKYGRPKDGSDIKAILAYLGAGQPPRKTEAGLSESRGPSVEAPAEQSRWLVVEQYIPLLGRLVTTEADSDATLYASVGEGDITASWLRRLHDGTGAGAPRIKRVVLLRIRDEVIAAMEGRGGLEKMFGKHLRANLAALVALLDQRGVPVEIRETNRIPSHHGYMYGDHLLRAKWVVGETGCLHVRTPLEHLTRGAAPGAFAEMTAMFESAHVAEAPADVSREDSKAGGAAPSRIITIALLVPLQEEWEQVLHVFPSIGQETADGTFYYHLESGIPGVRLVGSHVGKMGPLAAGLRAAAILPRFSPDLIALVGIAGALDGDVKLGDVVVADDVNEFLATSKTVKDGERFRFQYSGHHFVPSYALVEALRHFPQDPRHHQWQSETAAVRGELALPEDTDVSRAAPRAHVGHIASGDTVGAAEAYAVELRGIDRKFLALEMEAAGVAGAATRREKPVAWLVVRGISDFGDERKKDLDRTKAGGWRRYAMRSAAHYLRALLQWEHLQAHLRG